MENQEKRTLTSEEKRLRAYLVFLAICAVALIGASALNGFMVGKERRAQAARIAELETQLEAKEQEISALKAADASSITTPTTVTSATTPREPEPVKDYPELTKTYKYDRLADIPAVAPSDQLLLWVKVDQPCRKSAAGTVLAEYTYATANAKITFTIPDLGELSNECDARGYGVIGVLTEQADINEATFNVFAFNPIEEPYIEIWVNGSGRIYVSMDVQVFTMSFYSTDLVTDTPDYLGYYRSCGVSQHDYQFFGGSNSGNDDYYFNAFSVVPADKLDDWCRPLEWSKEDLDKYQAYWATNSRYILERKSYFSADRSEFDLISYLETTNVELKNVSAGSITMIRPGGHELIITKQSRDDGGDYAVITINGERVAFATCYTARINGLPTRVLLTNGIYLTGEQVEVVLKFIEHPRIHF